MLWELSLIGLRMELQALDRHLVHPPSVATRETFEIRRLQLLRDVLGGEPLDLTSRSDRDVGLNAYHVADRVKAVEAFRLLVSRWPGTPPSIVQAVPITVESTKDSVVYMERLLVGWYLQMFWEHAGRAATVPRTYPLQY